MAVTELKLIDWSLAEDPDKGWLDYTVVWLAVTNDIDDGPGTVRSSPLLPVAGVAYLFGNDSTTYVYSRRPTSVRRASSNIADKRRWHVTQPFSNRPVSRFDVAGPISDPLLEPPDISGSALKFMRRFTEDRNGDPLLMSSGERMTGPEVEDDDARLSIEISQNLATADLVLLRNTLRFNPWNDAILWGLPIETVKFADFGLRKRYKGDGTPFVNQTTKFEIGGDFVRKVLDEGFMRYAGPLPGNAAQRANPTNYVRAKDARGENVARLPLDGSGNLLTDTTAPYYHDVELKGSSNLLALGIPAVL